MKALLISVFYIIQWLSADTETHCYYEPNYSDTLEIVYVTNKLITSDTLYAGMAHYILVENEEEVVWAFFKNENELNKWTNEQSYDAYCRRIMYVYKEN